MKNFMAQLANKNNSQPFLINLGLFVIFLVWNCHQPLVADDFVRSAIDVLNNGTLFLALKNSYYGWSGRLSAEILAYVLFSKSYLSYFIPLINIVNSLVLVSILNLIYKLALGKNHKSKLGLFSLLYLTYFILIGTFAQDFLWKTVAIQYAWGALILLTIIWKFYITLEIKQNDPWWQILLYGLGGIFIGFYNEIYIAFIADIYLSVFIVYIVFKKPLYNLIKTQYIIFLLAVVICGIISIKAPGNFLRQQTYLSKGNILHYGILSKVFMTYVQFFRYGYHIVFAFILLWIGISTYRNRKIIPHKLVITLSFLLILLNIHILSFVEVAYFSPISGRMLLIMDSIIFLTFFKFFHYKLRNFDIEKYNYFFYNIGLIIIAYVTISYYQLYKFNLKREKILKNNAAANLAVPRNCTNIILKYPVYFDDITENKKDFRNIGFAAFYGKKSIVTGACSE
jgi:hypothetical protein